MMNPNLEVVQHQRSLICKVSASLWTSTSKPEEATKQRTTRELEHVWKVKSKVFTVVGAVTQKLEECPEYTGIKHQSVHTQAW